MQNVVYTCNGLFLVLVYRWWNAGLLGKNNHLMPNMMRVALVRLTTNRYSRIGMPTPQAIMIIAEKENIRLLLISSNVNTLKNMPLVNPSNVV